MSYRIYIDESGTHDNQYMIIGMLFVPQHGVLHAELCQHKDSQEYFNHSPKRAHKYREVHFTKFRSPADEAIGRLWVDSFIKHSCFYRSVVVDWSKSKKGSESKKGSVPLNVKKGVGINGY